MQLCILINCKKYCNTLPIKMNRVLRPFQCIITCRLYRNSNLQRDEMKDEGPQDIHWWLWKSNLHQPVVFWFMVSDINHGGAYISQSHKESQLQFIYITSERMKLFGLKHFRQFRYNACRQVNRYGC